MTCRDNRIPRAMTGRQAGRQPPASLPPANPLVRVLDGLAARQRRILQLQPEKVHLEVLDQSLPGKAVVLVVVGDGGLSGFGGGVGDEAAAAGD